MTTFRRWLLIALGAIAALAVAFASGRYTAPTKTVEVAKVEYKDRTITEFHAVAGPTHTVTKTVFVPATAGCPAHQETVTTSDTGPTVIDSHQDATNSGTSETTKTVEADRAQWSAELGGQWNPSALKLRPERIDVALGRRILGPAWVSAVVTAPPDHLSDLKSYTVGLRVRVEW